MGDTKRRGHVDAPSNELELRGWSTLRRAVRLLQQEELALDEVLCDLVKLLPKAWENPDITVARLTLDGRVVSDPRFRETPWMQAAPFTTRDGRQGVLEVACLESPTATAEVEARGEERAFLETLSELLLGRLHHYQDEEDRARNTLLLANLRDAAIVTNADGIVTFWNEGATELFGWTAEEMLGRRYIERFPESERDWIAQEIAHRLAGQEWVGEYEDWRKDGSRVWIDARVTRIMDSRGYLHGILGIARDITDRKRLEEQLRQAHKMEVVGRLAGGVAHDFNNVLTVISGYSEMLLENMEPDAPDREIVKEIYRSGERAALLTRQLLAFSRKQFMTPEIFNLNEVVTESVRMLRPLIGEDIQLTNSLAQDLRLVRVDPVQVERVIMNLVLNARDAMPSGGKLTIETANVELDENYSHSHWEVVPGQYVMLAVSDTGFGMDDETKSQIFEPFFSTKSPGRGTGLGLSTVYGIVKQSGGNVSVYSEPMQGTVFKIYLPVAGQPEATATGDEGHMPNLTGTETVLVVEDDSAVRSLARIVLGMYGYRVLEASHAMEAFDLSAQHEGPIHLLVTDVVMPGIGGRKLAEMLVPNYPDLKVLFLSGYSGDAVARHGVLEAEMAFLQKPFTPVLLASKVREVLDGHGEPAAHRTA
jgi:two-component system, cell cycle sensor histidine kinase and response regulator CckA